MKKNTYLFSFLVFGCGVLFLFGCNQEANTAPNNPTQSTQRVLPPVNEPMITLEETSQEEQKEVTETEDVKTEIEIQDLEQESEIILEEELSFDEELNDLESLDSF